MSLKGVVKGWDSGRSSVTWFRVTLGAELNDVPQRWGSSRGLIAYLRMGLGAELNGLPPGVGFGPGACYRGSGAGLRAELNGVPLRWRSARGLVAGLVTWLGGVARWSGSGAGLDLMNRKRSIFNTYVA
ncbi:hypothetical protein PoB_001728800 [Plakobranchus ocellatus]|uniref:Uncharacterized protein n=1 Tax=Plakobranchus ocellatus TaxID=259542 RepID=A0AAV3Z7S6_9GAST|nr:hypothetical protein PoB_001728800 [Plakobranchus ocellatus]